MRWVAVAGARWVALSGLYLVLAGELSPSEIVAGVLAGLLATLVSLGLTAAAERQFSLRAPWYRLSVQTARAVVRDIFRVALALAAAATTGQGGMFARQPFAGTGAEPAAAGRRALATLFASIAPNGYVTEITATALELHRLAPAPPAADREWPV
jgi:hypothetical protein